MFERFTHRARRVLVLAQDEARLLGHDFIGTEHILLGLISEGEGVAADALGSLGVSLEKVREEVAKSIGPASSPTRGAPPFTPRAKRVLELSLREAFQLGHDHIGTEHLLLGLVREGEGVAAQVLVGLGAELSRVRQQVIRLIPGEPAGRAEAGPARRPPRRQALVHAGPGVSAVPVPVDPAALVTSDDVEEVMRAAAGLGSATVVPWDDGGVAHRSCDYEPGALPAVTVSVAGAHVSREAFDRTRADRRAEPVEGLGDAAAYDASTSSVSVLKGSVLFSVTVRGHADPRAAATALARRAAERLDAAP